ncbi:hypothetical protein [Bartonella schoenbuchensis]
MGDGVNRVAWEKLARGVSVGGCMSWGERGEGLSMGEEGALSSGKEGS